ncbi:MAG: hypothetical protein LBL91_00520 [Lachnospiraceae bacterium]|jgi:hypothetical protein|nr:hypothetical protein [Lachnospiraceae bacterium]
MDNKMKNIVVLKNLPSNIVDEAIVILKCSQKQMQYIEKKQSEAEVKLNEKHNNKEYILKEAELVVNNYISNLEEQKKSKIKANNAKLERKYNRLKLASITIGRAICN